MISPEIALVIPVYNEAEVLPELLRRLAALFEAQPAWRWRAYLVDDGSRDVSATLIAAQAALDPRFHLLRLSRNFGFQAALAAGLDAAERDGAAAVVTLDADLQDPPELIPELVAVWSQGHAVVRAHRRSRQETGLRRLGMDVFHSVFHRLSDFPIDPNSGTFCLLDKAALAALNRLPERHRFFPGLRAWVGFAPTDVTYDRNDRAAGQPKQTFRRLLRYAGDGLFSFSYLPLRSLTFTGLGIGLAGFALGLYYVIKRISNIETAPTGFTTLAALVLFLGGIQLIGIGVLGEYLARIYDEAKRRPLYLLDSRPPPPARSE